MQIQQRNGKKVTVEKYFAETGQATYETHRQACKPRHKFHKLKAFLAYAETKILEEHWSPDALVGYAKVNGLFKKEAMVCAKTLYHYIDACYISVRNIDLYLKTRLNTKKQRPKQNKRCLGPSIETRSECINQREDFGHWEIDTVVGKKAKHEPALLTLTERKSRYEIILKLDAKNEATVNDALLNMFRSSPYFKDFFKSITSDNGSEFAGLHETLKQKCDVYFTHPYTSCERGTNEHHNGIIRRTIPKGISMKPITPKTKQTIANKMNAMPRKILGYRTPHEVFYEYFMSLQAINEIQLLF